MNPDALFALLQEARRLCGHGDYVVIGSLSVLGMAEVAVIPADMTVSIHADCYTPSDPGRVFELSLALGEGSAYHREHGVYLNPVSPRLATLPQGWEARLVRQMRENVTAHFLEPSDAAVSKLARSEPRDLRWVRAGVEAGLVSIPTVRLRMRTTSFLDDAEKQTALQGLMRLEKPSAG